MEILQECRRRLADAADLLAEFRTLQPDAAAGTLAEARVAVHFIDRAVFAVDRARHHERHVVCSALQPAPDVVRDVARTRLARGGDNYLLSDGQARLVANALAGNDLPALRRLAATGEIRRCDLEEIRGDIERVIDTVVAGAHALWEFGALRAMEIYVQRHGQRPPVPGWGAGPG